MDIESKFGDLGVDAVTGIKLMRLLNVSTEDFVDEMRFMRFKDVIDYFKDIPDTNYIINKVTVGKPVDKLDHVWGYVELTKQKARIRSDIEGTMSKIDTLSSLGDEMQKDMVKSLTESLAYKKVEAQKVEKQMEAYER